MITRIHLTNKELLAKIRPSGVILRQLEFKIVLLSGFLYLFTYFARPTLIYDLPP